MKTYSVVFDPDAKTEALEAADYIAQHNPDAADRWYAGLAKAIRSLAMVPSRCGSGGRNDRPRLAAAHLRVVPDHLRHRGRR